MKKNELKVWENRSIAHEKEWKYIKTFQSKVKRSIENSYLALLDVVEVEEEVEAAGNDDGACSIASLDDAVEEGSGCAVSFVRIAFLDPAPAPGDREGAGEGVGVGVDVGAMAEEDRWDLRPFKSGLIPDNKSTISPNKKCKIKW